MQTSPSIQTLSGSIKHGPQGCFTQKAHTAEDALRPLNAFGRQVKTEALAGMSRDDTMVSHMLRSGNPVQYNRISFNGPHYTPSRFKEGYFGPRCLDYALDCPKLTYEKYLDSYMGTMGGFDGSNNIKPDIMLRALENLGREMDPANPYILRAEQTGHGHVPPDKDGYYVVASFVSNNTENVPMRERSWMDYNFLRKDSNGLFSHKRGYGKVSDRDSNNRFIANPEKAALKYALPFPAQSPFGSVQNYNDYKFAGYLYVRDDISKTS